jgi:hypothetical protein
MLILKYLNIFFKKFSTIIFFPKKENIYLSEYSCIVYYKKSFKKGGLNG